MDSNIFSRLIIGLLLVSLVLLSYHYNLDYILYFFLIALVSYDLHNTKIVSNYFLFFLLFILCCSLFIQIEYISHIYVLIIFSTFLILFFDKYKKEIFTISIYLFCIILFYIIETSRNYFYILIFVSFFNDSIAYIAGKSIKGPLIIPKISPKKTWSGSMISFLMTSTLLYYLNFNIFFLISISISFFLGDIFFSYIKRLIEIKDFSRILGEHGGVLDRLDSMFFVAVILQIYLVFII